MEIEKNRYMIRNWQGMTSMPVRICDIVKVDNVLFVEFKSDKKVLHMPLHDFLQEVAKAQEKLRNA